MIRKALAVLAAILFTTPSFADIYGPGSGGAIVDVTTSSGTLVITNTNQPTIVSFNGILINATHTFVGDLTFILSHNGVDVQVFRQPGSGLFGDSSDLIAGGYRFVNSGAPGGNFHTAAIAAGFSIAPGTYNRSNVSGVTSPFFPADPDDFTAWDFTDINGTWTLTWRDNTDGDVGTVTNWFLDITSVPEPNALLVISLIGLAGLIGYRFRRR